MGYGTALAAILGAFTYTGGALHGGLRDGTIDEVSRKEHMRKNRRRPVEETVHHLGEGRGKSFRYAEVRTLANLYALSGVYAPGYAERRVERIKEAYGIDVTSPAPAVHPPSSS